ISNSWLTKRDGKELSALETGHTISGSDADWEFGRHHVASAANVERVRPGGGGGYAADGSVAEILRHFQAVAQLLPIQRGETQRGNYRKAQDGAEDCIGDGRGQSGHQRSR